MSDVHTLPSPPEVVVGFDTETERFGLQNLIPKLVCLTMAIIGEDFDPNTAPETFLAAVSDPPQPNQQNKSQHVVDWTIDTILDSGETIVIQNAAYDLAVLCRRRPDLIPRIFDLAAEGRFHCTKIREKLLVIADTGDLDYIQMGNGVVKKRERESMASLAMQYLGIDLSAAKKSEDSWRTNYDVLSDRPSSEWPPEAVSYAIEDSVYAARIWWLQEKKRREIFEKKGIDPFKVQDLQVAVDFCLYLMSAQGFAIDTGNVEKLKEEMEKELSPDKLDLLLASGILRPAEPPRPHARGARDHVDGCTKKGCDCPIKMTAGKAESMNTAALHSYVVEFCKRHKIQPKKTEPSKKFPEGQISVDAEWRESYAHLDPTLSQLDHRESLQKIITTEIPRLCLKDDNGNSTGVPSPVVHPVYDILKVTGRTSSYAVDHYPSFNIQNVDPRARRCIRAREGTLLLSVDFSQMELGTLAQRCLDLFGYSVLADKINGNVDVHAYLGAQLALNLDQDFQNKAIERGCSNDDEVFDFFKSLSASEVKEEQDFYNHYRKFAKPTNLGYPGGLGADTFIRYAKATYGVIVNKEQAVQFKETWKATYPEMKDYFDHINKEMVDPFNEGRVYTDDYGNQKQGSKYHYSTPLGMYRAGADYCAAANGFGLQSPSAEGAKIALFYVCRACFDPSERSILYGTFRPIGFIHDELVGEVNWDDMKLVTERVREVQRLMVEGMSVVTPRVQPKTEAALMHNWSKEAKSKVDENGCLTIWTERKEE